ncbi:MAG: signal peptidase II [Bacillota bacterium]|nr:signal peptidase II [Bacillota bacterium]
MFWFIILFCLALDQISKYIVSSSMQLGESIPVLGEFLQLHYILNDGATLSMLSGHRWFFVGLTVVVLAVVLYLHYQIPKDYKAFHIALAFFIGGTLGNFIDRLLYGAVVDFIDTPVLAIFNIADCFITVSVFFLCGMLLFGRLGRILDKKENLGKMKENTASGKAPSAEKEEE